MRVDIREVKEEQVKRVLAYLYKAPDLSNWTPAQILEFQALQRIKFSECYGQMRGVDPQGKAVFASAKSKNRANLSPGSPCPDCQQPLLATMQRRDDVVAAGKQMDGN